MSFRGIFIIHHERFHDKNSSFSFILDQWERISLACLKFSRDLVAFFFSMTRPDTFSVFVVDNLMRRFLWNFLSLLLIIHLDQWERLQLRGLKFSSESDALSMNFRWIFFLHVLCYHINISLKFFLSLARLSSWICICSIYMNALVLQLLDWWKVKVLLCISFLVGIKILILNFMELYKPLSS